MDAREAPKRPPRMSKMGHLGAGNLMMQICPFLKHTQSKIDPIIAKKSGGIDSKSTKMIPRRSKWDPMCHM